MSKVRYYTDENISKAVINGLRQRKVAVLSAPEAGMLGASDAEQLAFALENERVVFTQDDDFLRLAASSEEHAGIVYSVQKMPIGDVIRGLMLIYEVLEAEDMVGKVEYL